MSYRVLIAALLAAAAAQANEIQPPPAGWGFMAPPGEDPLSAGCQAGVDDDLAHAGQPNMTLRCADEPVSLVGLQQAFEASPYWGQRVRFSAELKADSVRAFDGTSGGGGLWIAVPSPVHGPRTTRAPERALSDWTEWEAREFVVDIPEGGQFIVIGFWLHGSGQIWIRDLAFEVVPKSVPVNLSFEDNPGQGLGLQLE